MEMKCFPITYQFDTMQCGIACLQMICKYYGRDYSLSYLSGICTSSAEGVSLHGINETAIQLGFHTLCARLDIKDTMEMPLPCILHWNQITSLFYIMSKREQVLCRRPRQRISNL